MTFYTLKQPDIPEWGDYGSFLMHGMTDEPTDGRLPLMRTGPFIPPISFPLPDVVVRDDFRKDLLAYYGDAQLRPVIKHKIVEVNWENWDRSRELSRQQIPHGICPEDYVLGGCHSEETARKMGEVWELVLTEGAASGIMKTKDGERKVVFSEATWNGHPIFRITPIAIPAVVVTEECRQWLERNVGDWVDFEPEAIETV